MEIAVNGLCKSYNGMAVLRNVTFTVREGVTCIMGPSGTGKTTLLRLLLGLEAPDSGTVTVPCRWAVVFQEDRLLEHLDAWGNLRFALGMNYEKAAAAAVLDELGLGDVEKKPVKTFSGGMKRRLALARALLADSGALALDEPFTGLDENNRRRALSLVRQAASERPVVLVTHEEADGIELNAQIINL